MRFKLLKKYSWTMLAAIMVLTNALGFLPNKASAADGDAMTVAEAIANNSGTGTVTGYIVGHATGSLSSNFQPPFSNDFNFLIADAPGEQNKAKLLDVQLTAGYRAPFGLQTNPGIIGKKIKVTGTLGAYNTFPGLKSPTALAFVDTGPEDPGVISIAEAKQAGGTVTIEGVVTADNAAIGGSSLSTFMQDSTGGINVYSGSPSGFPDLKEGDLIQVKGSITSYKNLTEISPTAITVKAHDQPLPDPTALTLADLQNAAVTEPYEGSLVRVTGYFQLVPDSPAGGGYNVQVIDQQFNGTTVRIMEGALDIAAVQQGKWYDVTGVLGQYTSYQILPRKASDLVLSANQPLIYPTEPGEYDAVVDHVVDGDTIALQSPLFGATNVRFLNIDTPESDAYINMNGGIKTPADQNQLDFGLAAKHYMETVLHAGDEVVLKIGDKATDEYGRLLAQVVRKSDSLNVNLHMVEQGHAVTYFIWPIGSADEYNRYQSAVKTAKDQGVGIWNPASTLTELPFVFRARFSGDGLKRPVGNSDTKIYVDKEAWASVPVDKRIFFNAEAEAAANGYTKDGGNPVPELPDGTGKKVLFDQTHGETAGAADWVIDGGFSDFADGLRANGFTVDSLERTIPYTFGEQAISYDKLKDYDVFIVGEVNIPFKKSEQDAMKQYVQDGGSIFFIADHYNADRNKNRWDSSEAMNGYRRGAWDNPAKGMSAEEAASPAMQGVQSSDWLAENFGVRFRFNALGDVDNVTDVVAPSQAFGITSGVSSVSMHAGSTLAIVDPVKAKGLVYVPKNVDAWANAVDQGVYSGGGRAEGPYAAVSKFGAGKAAFIGDSSPVEDITPKYWREDNGAKKTTYDGFKGEANNAVFLVRTVQWLAYDESYTDFSQVPGLQLDQPTPLLPVESPALTTEPKPEPWSAPDPGYKWYDPTTFKPGSYGSSQQPPVDPVYEFVHQNTLPNAQTFQIRVVANDLLPGQTISDLSIGIYLTGGTQAARFQNADGTWPTGYGYSANFSMTANAVGHAYKDMTVQINPSLAGSANLRLKVAGNNALTKAVSIANVPAEPLPNDETPVPEKISIAEARQAADNQLVTVEGIITSEPGAFGSNGFYIQDETAGIYVFQADTGFHAGDVVSISAVKTVFNTELELTAPVVLKKIGTASLPVPLAQSTLSEANQGRLVKLNNVVIHGYKTAAPAGSFEFNAVGVSGSVSIRIDGRTDIRLSEFQTLFPEGTLVNLTGISSIFRGVYQLKPLKLSDVELADAAAPLTMVSVGGLSGEGNYNNADVTLNFTVNDANGSGVQATEYRMNGGEWKAVQGSVVISVEGRNVIEYRSTDNAGNVEIPQTIAVWIDRTAPAIASEGTTAFYQTDSTISFSVSASDSLSGVKSTVYALDGANITSAAEISPMSLSAGTHTLIVSADDFAGNRTETVITLTVMMDLDHFEALIGIGEQNGWFKNHGTAVSLQAKASQLQRANPGKSRAALVDALKKEISKHSGKQIDTAFADLLLSDLAYMEANGL